jgi:predicted enzyme involved in methoxymalonyl-ACP biosynthesis
MILPPEYLPCFASRVMDIIRAVEGNIKKCLVAGLDNTIRNGVDEDTAAKKSGGYCRGFQQKHRS